MYVENVRVCVSPKTSREECVESFKFLLKVPCNLHPLFCMGHMQKTSSLRQLLKTIHLDNLIGHNFALNFCLVFFFFFLGGGDIEMGGVAPLLLSFWMMLFSIYKLLLCMYM
jgi:hypothetical protein